MKTLILFAMFGITSISYAEDQTPTTSALELSREETEKAPEGLIPYLGLGGGYTGYENVGATEGTPATMKLLGSYYLEAPVVLDLGYGVNNQQFTQASGNQDTASTSGALELAARYRWDNRWQAGIVANQFYEQGKVFAADQGDAHFVGLQALREFNLSPSWLARIGARAMSLTNNTDGLVAMYLVDLQIGWNPGAYKPSVRQTSAAESPVQREEERRTSAPAPARETAPARPVAVVEPAPALRDVSLASVMGAGGDIQFGSSRYALTTKDQQKLSRVAKALSENKDLFERVEVRGYADASGSATLNERISQQRANSVRSILRRNGLSANDVVAKGMGAAESTGVSASDRRAELVFIGVKDENRLREILSQIE